MYFRAHPQIEWLKEGPNEHRKQVELNKGELKSLTQRRETEPTSTAEPQKRKPRILTRPQRLDSIEKTEPDFD